MRNQIYIATRFGTWTLREEDGSITELIFDRVYPGQHVEVESVVLREAKNQLLEYLEGKRDHFTISLSPRGTDFQKSVWSELEKIPYGETVSYQEIACRIGNPKAVRAVGSANNHNPIAIFIPCHRVIGKDFTLTGYAGGINLKRQLLQLENSLTNIKI